MFRIQRFDNEWVEYDTINVSSESEAIAYFIELWTENNSEYRIINSSGRVISHSDASGIYRR